MVHGLLRLKFIKWSTARSLWRAWHSLLGKVSGHKVSIEDKEGQAESWLSRYLECPMSFSGVQNNLVLVRPHFAFSSFLKNLSSTLSLYRIFKAGWHMFLILPLSLFTDRHSTEKSHLVLCIRPPITLLLFPDTSGQYFYLVPAPNDHDSLGWVRQSHGT